MSKNWTQICMTPDMFLLIILHCTPFGWHFLLFFLVLVFVFLQHLFARMLYFSFFMSYTKYTTSLTIEDQKAGLTYNIIRRKNLIEVSLKAVKVLHYESQKTLGCKIVWWKLLCILYLPLVGMSLLMQNSLWMVAYTQGWLPLS